MLAGEVRGGAQEELSESVLLYPGLQNLACQAIVTFKVSFKGGSGWLVVVKW